ncbi:unnamed protein product [Coregonus sp. 'balchen']|nr:unnamed protein product [Coregonus sp. 'balchen']
MGHKYWQCQERVLAFSHVELSDGHPGERLFTGQPNSGHRQDEPDLTGDNRIQGSTGSLLHDLRLLQLHGLQSPRELLPCGQNFSRVPLPRSPHSPMPPPPHPHQDTIIIEHKRIFLSIKRPKTARGKRQDSPDLRNSSSSLAPPQTTQRKPIFLSPARKSQRKERP